MQICIFEDIKYSDFYPLTYSRPVYDLVCGITTLKEKIIREFPGHEISLHCRKYLEETVKNQNPGISVNSVNSGSCLFINGRDLFKEGCNKYFSDENIEDCVYKNKGEIVAVKLSGSNLEKVKNNIKDYLDFSSLSDLNINHANVKLYNYLWEMIQDNGSEIARDAEHLRKKGTFNIHPEEFAGVHFINTDKIYIRQNVTIKPGVVIDATNGPVYLESGAFIYPNAVIEGPVYIGRDTKIKSGATIYENVSIGAVCKVGGEVEDTIILPYSNKQHSGFIGHAYLGSWVNLGADTNCSDLKNNYSTIKVTMGKKTVDTGSQFLGVIIGDHSKTAINTMFNTGTIVGFSSNIFGAGFPGKFIPSFAWGGAEGLTSYDLKKGIETAKIVTKRRSVDFLQSDEELFTSIYNLTSSERND
jgi:UDP-N-acetylglucosamine diphosphorylase/glucosamine-1-phosphate N-acetyltransferase